MRRFKSWGRSSSTTARRKLRPRAFLIPPSSRQRDRWPAGAGRPDTASRTGPPAPWRCCTDAAGVAGYRMDLRVAAPAEHSQFLLRQHGEDLLRAGSLMLRPYQLDGGLMESFAGGFAVLTQPSTTSSSNTASPMWARPMELIPRSWSSAIQNLKVIFHDFSSHEKKICPGKSFKILITHYHKSRKNASLVPKMFQSGS